MNEDRRSTAASTARTAASRRMGSMRTATATRALGVTESKLRQPGSNGSVASGFRRKGAGNRMSVVASRRQTGAATVAASMRRKPETSGQAGRNPGSRFVSTRNPSVASSRWRAPGAAGPVRATRAVAPPPAPASKASSARRKVATPVTPKAASTKTHTSSTELNAQFESGNYVAHNITAHLDIHDLASSIDFLKAVFPPSPVDADVPNAKATLSLVDSGVFLLVNRATGRWESIVSKGAHPLHTSCTYLVSRNLEASNSSQFSDHFPVAASLKSGKLVLEASHESDLAAATEKLTALLANAGAPGVPALHAPFASPSTRDRSFSSFATRAAAFRSPVGKSLLVRILTGLEPADDKLRVGRSKTLSELSAKLNQVTASLLLGSWKAEVNRKSPANIIFYPERQLHAVQLELACNFFSAVRATIHTKPLASDNRIGSQIQFEADSSALDCLLVKTAFMLKGSSKFGKFSILSWSSINTSTTAVEDTDTFWLAFQSASAGPAERALQAAAASHEITAIDHHGLHAVGPLNATLLKPLLKAAHKAASSSSVVPPPHVPATATSSEVLRAAAAPQARSSSGGTTKPTARALNMDQPAGLENTAPHAGAGAAQPGRATGY